MSVVMFKATASGGSVGGSPRLSEAKVTGMMPEAARLYSYLKQFSVHSTYQPECSR